jgi:hypothetical protein
VTNWVPPEGFTVAPLEITGGNPPDPEFIRLPKPGKQCPYCGLGRGALYSLINEGRIHSITLRKRGHERGVRLIYYPSLRDYLHRLLKEQNPEN